MRLIIDHLPSTSATKHILRHWLTLDDGRIFYQDELLTTIGPGEYRSERSPWFQLQSPPQVAKVVGIIDHGGLPMAILDNGKSFLWDRSAPPEGAWCETFPPVPYTAAHAEWST